MCVILGMAVLNSMHSENAGVHWDTGCRNSIDLGYSAPQSRSNHCPDTFFYTSHMQRKISNSLELQICYVSADITKLVQKN
jgi:hypothetical protein